jgi:hypothetical protein
MPSYSNGTYFVWYEGFEFTWFINETIGTGAPIYTGSNEFSVPSSWSVATGLSPAPTVSECIGDPTTTSTTTTTTTTPPALMVSNATYEPTVNGNYSVAGSINGTTYYVKTLGGTYYLHRSSYSGDYPEWNITNWPPCEDGTRDCFPGSPTYYASTAPISPPVSGWLNPGNGEDETMTVIIN